MATLLIGREDYFWEACSEASSRLDQPLGLEGKLQLRIECVDFGAAASRGSRKKLGGVLPMRFVITTFR